MSPGAAAGTGPGAAASSSRIVFPAGTDLESLSGDMRSNGEAEAAAGARGAAGPAEEEKAETLPRLPPLPQPPPAPPSSSSPAVRDDPQESKPESAKCLPTTSNEDTASRQPQGTELPRSGGGGAVAKKPPLPPAGQFTKSAQKRRKAKAKRQLERERAAAAAASANPNSAGFSYSVKYFNWAVSSSESEGDDDDDDNDCCPTVVLPVSMARMRLNESRKS